MHRQFIEEIYVSLRGEPLMVISIRLVGSNSFFLHNYDSTSES